MNWRTRRHLCKTGGLSISGEPPNLVSFSGNLITSQVGEPFRCHLPYHSWLQNFGTLVHHCKKVLVGDLKPSRGQLGGDSSLSICSTVNGRLGSCLSGFLGAKFNLTYTGVHWLLAPLESCWYVATIQPNNSFDYHYQLCADIMAATDILLYKHKVIWNLQQSQRFPRQNIQGQTWDEPVRLQGHSDQVASPGASLLPLNKHLQIDKITKTDQVSCVAINNSNNLAASGGWDGR